MEAVVIYCHQGLQQSFNAAITIPSEFFVFVFVSAQNTGLHHKNRFFFPLFAKPK